MHAKSNEIQTEKLHALAKKTLDYSAGLTISASIYLGDKLGLYQAMKDQPPMSSRQLAQHQSFQERWVREWLRGQVAAGLIDYSVKDDTYQLSKEAGMILADENSAYFQAGSFSKILSIPTILHGLENSFKTGEGFSFDIAGAVGAHEVEKTFAPWYRTIFLQTVLPVLENVENKLVAGAKVADIGCGAGIALLEMANKFPNSQFYGYEISRYSLERAAQNKRMAGIVNVNFLNHDKAPLLQDHSFDFITLFDTLHDMTDPQAMLIAIQKALKSDGTLFIADLNTKDSFAENLTENPFLSHMYSWSLLYCLPCSLSKPNGAGLGALGLSKQKLNSMLEKADLKIHRQHDFGNPLTAYYEIKRLSR